MLQNTFWTWLFIMERLKTGLGENEVGFQEDF